MSAPTAHICRACDEPITEPEEAVAVLHDAGNSGPGWTVWAHRRHADDIEMIDPELLRIMIRVWAAGG